MASDMLLRKVERSSQAPGGWRLATVEEAKGNLEAIKRDNLLKEWDRVRLLDGWMGGDGYGFIVEEGFRPCLGYMLLLNSPTSHISVTGRRAVTYSDVLPKLSKEGRNAAAMLCCEDSNEDVLHCLVGAKTEVHERKEASEVVSGIARQWQNLFAESRSIYSSDDFRSTIKEYLEDLVDHTDMSLTALMTKIPNSMQRKLKDEIVKELKTNNYLPENININDEDYEVEEYEGEESGGEESEGDENEGEQSEGEYENEGEESGGDENEAEVFPEPVCYVEVEKVALRTFHILCSKLYFKMEMSSEPSLTYLMSRAYALNLNKIIDEVSKGSKPRGIEASDHRRYFNDLSLDQTVTSEDTSDVLSSCLLREAKENNINVVERLLESGVEPSPKNGQENSTVSRSNKTFDTAKWSPLHYGAWNGKRMMCTLLIKHKASVRARDECGRTPLVYSLMFSDDEVVRVLISAEGVDEGSPRLVDIRDGYEFSVFHFAVGSGVPANMIVWLLSLSSQPESHFGPKGLNENNLSEYLRESSRMGYVALVQSLLGMGADPFQKDAEDKTSLHYAAEAKDKTSLHYAAEAKDKTSLHYAAEAKDENLALQIIEKLLADKNDGSINWEKVTVGDKYGTNVLHIAAFLGRIKLCSVILKNKTDMIDSKDHYGQIAMHYAVAGPHDDPDVISFLISRGATNILVKDKSETTLLHVAASKGNLNIVKELLRLRPHEKYVETADVHGQTALHKAASGGHMRIVEELLRLIPDKNYVEIGDEHYQTERRGHPGIVEKQLEMRAHLLNARDCDGKTVLDFAAQANAENAGKIADLLLKKCESDEHKSFLLFTSAVGNDFSNSSLKNLENFLLGEKDKIGDRKVLKMHSLRVAAKLGDIDLTIEIITKGANISIIHDTEWRDSLSKVQENNVQEVLSKIRTIVVQGTDKPSLEDNLGRSSFAIGLAALFLNPFVKSPVTVGISGEWGMGKSSVMIQTEINLLKAAAQLTFTNSSQNNDLLGGRGPKLSITGQAMRRKIGNAIDKMDAESRQVKNSTTKVPDGHNSSRVGKFWNALQILQSLVKFNERLHHFFSGLRGLWEESKPFDLDNFLENKYQLKYHQIFKSLAVIDRHHMFEEDKDGSTNHTSEEEYSLQGTTPSILTVQYNAWHYRNETEAWAGLAVQITKELEATMIVAHKLRTSWIYNWRNRRNNICFEVILPYFIALMVAIWFSIIVWFVLDTKHKDLKKLKYGGLPISMIVAAWGLGKSVISFVKPISRQVLDYICIPNHSQKLGYHQQVINDINFLKENLHYERSFKWEVFAFFCCCVTWSWDKNNLPGTKIRKMPPACGDNLRMIVFVDDLDRCEENVILQVLSAVNLVLAACHINVVLGMENSMIKRAIQRKYGNNNSKDDKSKNSKDDKSNEELAEKYLRKIVQLPLYLPDPSDSESRDFLERQLGIWKSTEDIKEDSIESAKKTENETAQGDNPAQGQSKANPKFQIATTPENFSPGRTKSFEEYKAELETHLSSLDTHTAEQVPGQRELSEMNEISEGSEIQETIIEMPHTTEGDEKGEQAEINMSKTEGKLMKDISTLISAMLIPRYSELQKKAFSFLHDRCTGIRKLPREWKCFLAYHRLAWNICTLTPQVKRVEGWRVQLIAWIFVCWEWRDLITILITRWNKLEVLRNWKSEEEPSLRDIVEHYIEERWKTINTSQMKVEAIDQEEGKPMAEENMTLDDMKKALRQVLEEQKEMRDMLKMIIKNVCKENDREGESSVEQGTAGTENQRRMIKKIFMEEEDEEGESSLQLYTMAEENRISKKARDAEEREEWIRLRYTLRRYNVSMDSIKAFQKFRFHCQVGHLPWPLPKQD